MLANINVNMSHPPTHVIWIHLEMMAVFVLFYIGSSYRPAEGEMEIHVAYGSSCCASFQHSSLCTCGNVLDGDTSTDVLSRGEGMWVRTHLDVTERVHVEERDIYLPLPFTDGTTHIDRHLSGTEMSNRRRLSQDARGHDVTLRLRIKELEDEVCTLKRRLDELRKAKNTTVMKREREVLQVGVPFSKRDSRITSQGDEKRIKDLETQLSKSNVDRQTELEQIRKTFAEELEELKKQNNKEANCAQHEIEISILKSRLNEAESDNAALIVENTESKERIQTLLAELSIKEANWCETEEKYKLEIKHVQDLLPEVRSQKHGKDKLKTSWGKKYAEWMSATERKIEDLEATNQILRGYLKNQLPGGPDPSGQDPSE